MREDEEFFQADRALALEGESPGGAADRAGHPSRTAGDKQRVEMVAPAAEPGKRGAQLSRCEDCGESFERGVGQSWKRRCLPCWRAARTGPPDEPRHCFNCGIRIETSSGPACCRTCSGWRRWYAAHCIGSAALREVYR